MPERVTTEADYDRATAINGASLRQCQASAQEAIDQSDRAKLRSDE